MSYIIKRNNPLVNLKLTDTGRRNLSAGELNFSTFSLGDGEMDYSSVNPSLLNVLRPVDNNPEIQFPVPSNGTTYKQPITQITSFPIVTHKTAKTRGFFSGSTANVVDPSLCSLYNISGSIPTGSTTSINLKYVQTVTSVDYVDVIGGTGYTSSRISTGYTTNVKVGDYLFLKVLQHDYYTGHTTSMTPHMDNAIQFLMYQITSVNAGTGITLSSIVNNQIINFGLDRDLPNFSKKAYVKAFIYPGKNTIPDYYDKDSPIAYWSNGDLDFTPIPGQTDIVDVPVWNMNIINIRDIVGLDLTKHKDAILSVGKNYEGTAINYGYLSDIYTTVNPNTIVTGLTTNIETTGYTQTINKIGVIHYTNNTIENFYGEGFYNNTLTLNIPYLMWHKQQFGGTGLGTTVGYTFICDSVLKYYNNTVAYYDLIDQEADANVVGKVLVDQKIIIIEDAELLSALSYKANRNWTLPTPQISLVDVGHCAGGNIGGSLQPNECIHMTYLCTNNTNVTGIQCENYQTIVNNFTKAKDVLFQFPKKSLDPTYSEFSFLRGYGADIGLGFTMDNIYILWQKTEIGGVPDPAEWRKYNINAYVGTTGCLSEIPEITDRFYLQTETIVNPSTQYLTTTKVPIGEVLVFHASPSTSAGVLVHPASSPALSDGNYYIYPLSVTGSTTGTPIIKVQASYISGSNVIEFAYLYGTTSTSSTVKQEIVAPAGVIPGTNTYLDGIYLSGGHVCLTLNQQPNNNTVYLFYNGALVSSNNYGVFTTGTTATRRVQLTFTPSFSSKLTLFYLDNSGGGSNPYMNLMTSNNINNLRVYMDLDSINNSITNYYDIGDVVDLPAPTATGMTFGDEVFFYGNLGTDIKATIYKTLFTFNVIPNTFISTSNPTFNVNQDKVAFTEVGIYDNSDDLVAIGKFSQPITRKYNSDIISLQATIDF